MRFKEDSIFLLLPTNAAICENFLLPKYIRPKISALTVRPRNQKSEFSPLFSLLSDQVTRSPCVQPFNGSKLDGLGLNVVGHHVESVTKLIFVHNKIFTNDCVMRTYNAKNEMDLLFEICLRFEWKKHYWTKKSK